MAASAAGTQLKAKAGASDADADDPDENEDDPEPLAAFEALAQEDPCEQNRDGAVE
jgi:hypothetical protein